VDWSSGTVALLLRARPWPDTTGRAARACPPTASAAPTLDGADATRTFVELGANSLDAVELCDRLSILAGVPNPSTAVFA
jgi:hypothetical protein